MESDSALVGSVKEGRTAAFAELVTRYERAARVAALRTLGDWHAAEDVVQEAFVLAYRRLDSLHDGSKFGPWLLRITRREALRAARKRPAAAPLEADGEPVDPAQAEPPTNADRSLIELAGMIDRLPSHERTAVTLHYLDGRRAAEIAQITGRSVGTITKQLSRALVRLRRWAKRKEARR